MKCRRIALGILLVFVLAFVVGCGLRENKNTESQTEVDSEAEITTEKDTTDGNSTEENPSIKENPIDKYSFRELDQIMYVKSAVWVRALPTVDGEQIGSFAEGREVKVTGQCKETHWWRVEYKGGIGYVSEEFLTDVKPGSENTSTETPSTGTENTGTEKPDTDNKDTEVTSPQPEPSESESTPTTPEPSESESTPTTPELSEPESDEPEMIEYKITVTSAEGHAIYGAKVSVYVDNTLRTLAGEGVADVNGTVDMTLPECSSYVVVVSELPKGCQAEAYYSLDSAYKTIATKSTMVKNGNIAATNFAVGDVMYDFTVTDVDGKEFTLSKVLQEKEFVVLNFWASWCGSCMYEFPYMEQAYSEYADRVGVIALDIESGDSEATIQQIKQTNQLSFSMARGDMSWLFSFGSQAIPTSVLIDRYGTICQIHVGAITSKEQFTAIFEEYTKTDYKQPTFN